MYSGVTPPADGSVERLNCDKNKKGEIVKKLLLAVAIFCACCFEVQGAEIPWTATGGTIPNDGNTYVITTGIAASSAEIIVEGIVEIRAGGSLRPWPYNVNINGSGTINITGGSLRGGYLGNRLNIGNGGGTTATINLHSGGIYMDLCYSNGSGVKINQYGGTITSANIFFFGGTFNMYDGAFNLTGGQPLCSGTMNLYGGQTTVTGSLIHGLKGTLNLYSGATFTIPSGYYPVAQNSHSTSFNVLGGTFILDGGQFRNGYYSPQGSTGTFNATSGIVDLRSGTFYNGYDSNSGGVLNISESTQLIVSNGSIATRSGPSTINIFGSNDFLVSGNTITNGGTFAIPTNNEFIIEAGKEFVNNGTLNVNPDSKLNIFGDLKNKSSSSVNVYGTVYTYSYLENGDGSNPGALNINYPGNLYLLGAELRNGNAGSAININDGGTLHNYVGTVDVNLGNFNLNNGGTFNNVRGNYPATLTAANGTNFFDGDIMMLDRDLELEYTWTVTEKAKLFGNGNKITFGTDGGILIQGADAALLLENVLIENIYGNQIRCSDDSTTLSIDNVVWIQDANYSFTKGTLNINGNWLVQGRNTTFAYSSDQASMLQQDTNWIFDTNVTFSYDSASSGNIVMTDATSKINFDGATLHVSQDAQFKDGTFVFDDIVTLNTEVGRTLYLGNNNASQNLTLDFHNLSKTIIAGSGTLTNQNV